MSGRKALFLDLGGTMLRVEDDEIYTDHDGKVEFLPNAVETVRRVSGDFDVVFVVTNQASIDEGTVSVEQSRSFVEQTNEALGGVITDFWACPRRASLAV